MTQSYRFFNINRISEEAKINKDKFYNNLKGNYETLTDIEKDRIVKVLSSNLKEVLKKLGYGVTLERLK
jgi:hypothetical protein